MKKITICLLVLFSVLALALGLFVGDNAVIKPVYAQTGSSATTDASTTSYIPTVTSAVTGDETTTPDVTTGEPEITSSAESTTDVSTSSPEVSSSPEETTEPAAETTDSPETTEQALTTQKAVETTAPAKKPVVGISASNESGYCKSTYVSAAKDAGFDVVILPFVKTEAEAKKQLKKVDAVIMTGGEDLDPSYYGETALENANLDIYAKRDVSDMLYINTALAEDIPMLGICRGMQLINVALGGTLYQDVPTQITSSSVEHKYTGATKKYVYHNITCETGSLVYAVLGKNRTVNSWHHQAIKTTGTNVVVTALADDGIIEAIEVSTKTFVAGLQFHPEAMYDDGNTKHLKFYTALYNSVKTREN